MDDSSTDGEGTAGDYERCTTCGGRVDTNEWHPIRVRSDGDGATRVDAFCSQHCRDTASGRTSGD